MGTTESLRRYTRGVDEELSQSINPRLVYSAKVIDENISDYLKRLLSEQREIIKEIYELGVERRLAFLEQIRVLWREKFVSKKYEPLIEELSKKTGYSKTNVELDLSLVERVFNKETIEVALDKGLIGGYKSLDEPILIGDDEYIVNRPIGSVYIIASGNSVVPPLIPTVISLAIGNLTFLRPSLVNFDAIEKVYEVFKEAYHIGVRDAEVMIKSLALLRLRHDDPLFDELLAMHNFSAINYWGGEPGRSRVVSLVAKNPYRPKLIINGPLTGILVIDSESITTNTIEKVALEVLLYDQQLCSSPTFLFFIGNNSKLEELVDKLQYYLNTFGERFAVESTEGSSYRAMLNYKKLILSGKRVLSSMKPSNPWLLILNEKTDEWPSDELLFYERRRALEIIKLQSIEDLSSALDKLSRWLLKSAVDGIQTITYSLSHDNYLKLIKIANLHGIYRIVPLGNSYLRTPAEPYDGEYMPANFSKALYIRKKVYWDL